MANPSNNNTEATAKDDHEINLKEFPLPKNSQTNHQHNVFLTPPPVQNQDRTQPQPVVQDNKMNVPNPELDIKACSFETLVGFLDSMVFRRHLLAILNFLRSEAIELEFRNSYTSKYVEEVLHRIARNVDNLELLTKDSNYGEIAKEIKDVLKHSINNKIFMVACAPKKEKNYSYLNGRFVEYRQFLYYRKMFYPERPKSEPKSPSKMDASANASEKASDSTSENISVNASEDAASVNVSESASVNASENASVSASEKDSENASENAIANASENTSDHTSNASVNTESSTKKLISQASVVEPVDPNRSSIDTQSPRNKFISLCLQILSFVKDITQTRVEFCGLDSDVASFVYTLFSSAVDDSFDNAIKAKKACIQLREAVKIRSCDYEFSIRYLRSTLTKKYLLLEKRHKNSALEDIFITEPSINRQLKKSKIKHQERLQRLGSKFVMSTFRTMLEFLSDESEASVIIKVSNKDEDCFVVNILNIARSNDIKSIFNDKARKIVDEVHRLAEEKTSYRIIQTKSKWTQGLLGINFAKVPLGEKDSSKQRKPSKARFEKATLDEEDPPKEEKPYDAEVVSDHCPQNEDCPKYSRAWYNRVESAPKDRVNLKRKWQDTSKAGFTDHSRWNLITGFSRDKPPGSYFTIQPVKKYKSKMNKVCTYVSLEADSKLAAVMFKYDITSNKISYTPMVPPAPKVLTPRKRTIEERHDQLIEALSVPVQSDKAMKMMLGMGWKGGALGAREDGITEPIMPHLNNSTAGLGHTDRQSKLKKVITKIPMEISPVSSGRSSAELSARSSAESPLGSLPRSAGSLPPPAGSLPPPTGCLPSPTGSLPPRARSLPRLARSRRPPTEPLPPPDPDNMAPVTNKVFRKPIQQPLPSTYMGKRTEDAFKKFFMGHLHCMAMTPELPMLRILVFQYALKKREKEFVRHMLKHFSDRNTDSFIHDVSGLAKDIETWYKKDSMIVVTATVSQDKFELILEKSRDLNRTILYEVPKEIKRYIITDFVTYGVQEFLDRHGLPTYGPHSIDDLKYKIGYLLQILKFVKNKDLDTCDVKLDEPAISKLRFYTYHLLQRINEIDCFGTDNPVQALSGAIKKYIVLGDYWLHVKFNDDKTMYTLTKEYYDLQVNEESINTPEKSDDQDKNNVGMIIENTNDITENNDDIIENEESKNAHEKSNRENKMKNQDVALNVDMIIENIDYIIENCYDTFENEESKATHDKNNHHDPKQDKDVVENVDKITENIDHVTEKLDDIIEKIDGIIKTVEEITGSVQEIADNVEVITVNADIKTKTGKKCKINENVINIKQNANVVTECDDKTHDNGSKHGKEKVADVTKEIHLTHNSDVIHISDDSDVDEKTSVIVTNNNIEGYDYTMELSENFVIIKNKNIDEEDKDDIINVIEEPMDEDISCKMNKTDGMTDNMSAYTDDSAAGISLDCSEAEDIEDISMSSANNTNDKLKNYKSVDIETDKSENIDFKSNACETALKLSKVREKTDVKIVYLTKSPTYSKDHFKYIQTIISSNIIQTKDFPLLKCHGVQNNILVYSCHTKKSYEWLINICVANKISTFTKEFDKMSMKINSFIDFDEKALFGLLESYNEDISTKKWSVLKKEIVEDCIVFEVQMDKKSFQFILDSDLALFAGVDKVTFNIIFDD